MVLRIKCRSRCTAAKFATVRAHSLRCTSSWQGLTYLYIFKSVHAASPAFPPPNTPMAPSAPGQTSCIYKCRLISHIFCSPFSFRFFSHCAVVIVSPFFLVKPRKIPVLPVAVWREIRDGAWYKIHSIFVL